MQLTYCEFNFSMLFISVKSNHLKNNHELVLSYKQDIDEDTNQNNKLKGGYSIIPKHLYGN